MTMEALLFLLKLAWHCRLRLPLIIVIGFMILDIRMQLDINVESRRIPRPPEVEDYEEHEEDEEVEINETTANSSSNPVTA